MKAFCIMLALLFSFLTCYPCADEQPCKDEVASAAETNFLEEQHSSQPDFCSPFCICSCCHHQLTGATDFRFEVFVSSYDIVNSDFYYSVAKTISLSIWQPPRLA